MLSGPNSPDYQEPNLSKTVCGEEGRGNLACAGEARVQLGGVKSTERDWNRLFLGLPCCPHAHIQSCIIHTLHYLRSSITVGHSRARLYRSPSRPLNSRFEVVHWWVGDVGRVRTTTEKTAEENGCTGCCHSTSLGCNFERCERAQSAGGWATMVWTVCNGISMLR